VADVPNGPSLDSTPHYENLKKKRSEELALSLSYNKLTWSCVRDGNFIL
jgi:hypothetical protein